MSAFAALAYRERVPPLRRVVLPTLLAVSAGCAGSLQNPERFSDGGAVVDGGAILEIPESSLAGNGAMTLLGLNDAEVNRLPERARHPLERGRE